MTTRLAVGIAVAVVLLFLFIEASARTNPAQTIIGVPVGCAVTPDGCPSSTP
jgi:hypothetical protein